MFDDIKNKTRKFPKEGETYVFDVQKKFLFLKWRKRIKRRAIFRGDSIQLEKV